MVSPSTETVGNLVRALFSGLALLALGWAAYQMLMDLQQTQLPDRPSVIWDDLPLLFPALILILPVVLLNNPIGPAFLEMIRAAPEELGAICILAIVFCLIFVILWLFETDPDIKKTFADGIKMAVGAALGAVTQRKTRKRSDTHS